MHRPFPFSEIRTIWMNGEQVAFEKATVHGLSHALHYGSSVFEGIRCYKTRNGAAVFRLGDHLRRLLGSCKIYRMEPAWNQEQLTEATLETIRLNEFEAAYVRPLVWRGFGSIRMDPRACPVEAMIATWPTRGSFLGPEVVEKGIAVGVSSWRRPAPGTLPVAAKAGGNYLSSQLITMEAVDNGFSEMVALDVGGMVSEGATDNVFLVKDGVIRTPPLSASILPGITRASVIALAGDLGFEVEECAIPRGELYLADEMFLTGTAVEVTPVTSIDRLPVGNGRPGPVTRRLLEELRMICEGEREDRHGWLTPVYGVRTSA